VVDLLWVLLGIGLLTMGGEGLIRGALAIAKRFGVSPLLCGLVIVGFGTSAPELAVSVDAALQRQPEIAVGNVVGSNIGNILLILGLCAIICPLAVKPLALRRDAVTMVMATVLVLVLFTGGGLGRIDATVLFLSLVGYLCWAYLTERNHRTAAGDMLSAESTEVTKLPDSKWLTATWLIGGLGLLILGSQVLLKGAIGLAASLGVSETLVGLTLVAVGTSLPELTVSVIAALRRHADVAVGNILGSNIFNALGILGVSALLQPLPVQPRILMFDQWVMLASAVLLLLFLFTGRQLSRMEGVLLFSGYILYVGVGAYLG